MSRRIDGPLNCKVYVGGLPERASRSELEDLFGRFGHLRDVWVARHPPGFAFIQFEDARDAEDAVRALDGTRMCGVRARVEMSSDRKGGGGGRRGGGDFKRGGDYDDDHSNGRSRYNDRDNDRRGGRSPPIRRPISRSRSRSRSPRGKYSQDRRSRSVSPVRHRGGGRDRSPYVGGR